MPNFLITIDTEGDNAWEKPRQVTTRNAQFLPRFQALCEKHQFKPTYLTNHEMATSQDFVDFGRDVLARNAGEIGMHLHAWNSPPLNPLTADDLQYQPFLIEYPESVIREKVAFMTGLLEDTFGMKMVSHRAGRWSFDTRYARILVEHGYRVDCSVTPHVSWRQHLGDPQRQGGTDYTDYPDCAYFVDLGDLKRPGRSPLLELPMTIVDDSPPLLRALRSRLTKQSVVRWPLNRWLKPRIRWLRPNGKNLDQMLHIVQVAARQQRPYIEFMLHSSEFMPGGSPSFRTTSDIEHLYHDLETLFTQARKYFSGVTLAEYHKHIVSQEKAATQAT